MSMLTEKRTEIQNKLNAIMSARANNINARLAAYKAQLEAEPIPAEAVELKKVLAAIDEVIAYDNSYTVQPAPVQTEPVVAPVVEEIQHVEMAQPVFAVNVEDIAPAVVQVETAIPAGDIVSRPGMATVNIPERG